MNLSILQRAGDPVMEPYPHLVIDNCLPDDLYDDLEATRPSDEFVVAGRLLGSNQRIDLHARELLIRPIADIWQQFIMHHLSRDFWMEIVQVFDLNGALLTRPIPPLDQISVTMRRDPPERGTVSMDVNVGVNTPVIGNKPTTVRGPHVDNPIELFAAMLYMPPKGAPDEGGDFVIYRKNQSVRFVGKAEVDPKYCPTLSEHVRVKYKRNTMVCFINSVDAIHGVTPRQSGNFRRLVNFVAELPFVQFALPR
jgi:hypothetical protein